MDYGAKRCVIEGCGNWGTTQNGGRCNACASGESLQQRRESAEAKKL